MNPEEGELRPHLLDRFGPAVDVFGTRNLRERMAVIRAVWDFQKDPLPFCRRLEIERRELRERTLKASGLPSDVFNSEGLPHEGSQSM